MRKGQSMKIADQMYDRLEKSFQPRVLEVVDDSARHAGHAGVEGASGETHFNVKIRAAGFADQSRVMRHRMVHKALGDLVPRIHALALDLDV